MVFSEGYQRTCKKLRPYPAQAYTTLVLCMEALETIQCLVLYKHISSLLPSSDPPLGVDGIEVPSFPSVDEGSEKKIKVGECS